MKNIDRAKQIYLSARGASWNLAGDANKPIRQELMTCLTGKKQPIAVCGVTHLDAAIRAELKSPSHGNALEKEIAAWCGYTGPLQAMAPTKATAQPETMELPVKLIGSASTDPQREIINGIFIDAEKRAVVATNGRILAKLDIPGSAPVKGGMISPQLWKAARAMTKKGPLELDFVKGTIATLPYPTDQARGSYPNWPAVVPAIEKPAYRLCFDPALLIDLAESLGRHDQAKGVTLDLDASCDTPIVVTIAGNSGVIMPMNKDGNPNGHGLRITAPQAERSALPAIDRAEMVRNPIGWLQRLNVELRYLENNTPHGGYIADYLELVDAGDYESFETAETARYEALDELETANDELKMFTELVKQIHDDITATFKEGIQSRTALGSLIIRIANDIQESNTEFSLDSDAISEAISEMEDLSGIPEPPITGQFKADSPAIATPPQAEHSAPSPHSEINNPQSEILNPSSTSPVLSRNAEKNGIELRFPEKPTDAVRAEMKSHGFKWAAKQPGQPWYARYSEERWVFAMDLSGQGITPADTIEPESMSPAPTESEPEVSPVASGIDAFADF